MRAAIATTAVVLCTGATALAEPRTWTGRISDSMCGSKHTSEGEHSMKMTDKECTLECIKDGSKYVLMADGKEYQIANQDAKGLEARAGETVRLTGELKGNSITVSKVEAVAPGR